MMYNEPHAVRCTRAHVYKDKGRLYIDYWGIDEDHYRTSNLENLADTIIGIITEHAMGRINNSFIIAADTEEVSW